LEGFSEPQVITNNLIESGRIMALNSAMMKIMALFIGAILIQR
jgi:hypothetical protein